MRSLLEKYLPLRENEGGGMGGGAGAGGGGAGGGAGAWSAPEGLPEQFRGSTADETLSKLLPAFSEVSTRAEGLRTKLAGLPKAPEKPDLYSYNPSDKLKPYFGDLAQNPIFAEARNAFHKHGAPQEMFAGIIEDLYGPLVDQGLLGAPYDPKAELTAFASELGLDAASATKALTDTDAFAKGLLSQLRDIPEKLKPEVEAQLMSLTDTAAGNILLRALSGRLAENGIRIGGEGNAAGAMTAEDLKKLDADPRIDPNNRNHPDPAQRFDEALRKRYDEAYQRLAPANKTAW
ncbi:hypothetical protein MIC97_16600 [Aquamicrobium sp. NLF2-7]|uniref:hypothetical protein n=1 Tax=Aquamicrobium sp. NLF2-7 TaxID=2918753 RepID=UPI001EFB1043|nr:hypothetical protein [Aquamicrobium sp. NLF2-7]MCG8273120.1 hypothetical protein [Aquamicrobium sp. NLF2-7]